MRRSKRHGIPTDRFNNTCRFDPRIFIHFVVTKFFPPECIKDERVGQWKSGNFDPLSPKSLNRSSPKFAWVIMSETPTHTQNFITIRLSFFVPKYAKMLIKPLGYFFGI